jgi:hypothetical protein
MKKTPKGILKNKDTPTATKKKSAQSIVTPNLGVNNSATARAKGKKKSRGRKVSFNGKKAEKAHKIMQITNQATRETHKNYEFIPNLAIFTHLNACHVLGKTPTGVYFAHFTNKQFHDHMTKKIIPAAASTVLGFGLKFIPIPKKSIRQDDVNKSIKQFDHDFYLKVFFANDDNTSDDEEPIEKLRVTSKWMPDQPPFKITQQLGNFEGAMQQNFCPKRGKSNLTKFQARILQEICSNKHIIFARAHKNLGPVGVDTERYICWALNEHLLDTNTYFQESKEEARTAAFDLFMGIYMWMRQHQMCSDLTKDATAYIWYWIQKNHHDPFGYFYLTVKIHKGPLSTLPVCLDCASLVHPLGKWLNYRLQPVVACQPFYFKDSFLLKQESDKLVLPPNASIITFEAIAMYRLVWATLKTIASSAILDL